MENLLSFASKKEVTQTLSKLVPLQQMRIRYKCSSLYSGEQLEEIKKKSTKKVLATSKSNSHPPKQKGKSSILQTINRGALESLNLVLSECQPHSSRKEIVDHVTDKLHVRRENIVLEEVHATVNKYDSQSSIKNKKNRKGQPSSKSVNDENKNESRWNEVNIQMLSPSLFSQLFGRDQESKGPSTEQVERAQQELSKHNLLNVEKTLMDDITLKLPKLEGQNIEEHFYVIGERQCAPYRQLLNELVSGIPRIPEKWILQPGWTRYCNEVEPHSVPFPQEDAFVFDVEVCVSNGQMPTLATAVSNKAWYGWVSHSLLEGAVSSVRKQHYMIEDLIPLESGPTRRGWGGNRQDLKKPRVVVGHNVSYDRARTKEQYWLESTGTRFVDTMSMHVCVSGVTSYQRAVLKTEVQSEEDNEWRKYSSLNSLSEVHKLYCGSMLDKSSRDVFVTGSLSEILEQFQQLMMYCAGDVMATHNILTKLLPIFLERFPHPVTLAGMLELSIAYLPVNSNWCRFLSDAQQTFEDLDSEARFLLSRRADESCKLLHEEKYREDIWLWDQDWSVQKINLKKGVVKKSSIEKNKPDKCSIGSELQQKKSIETNYFESELAIINSDESITRSEIEHSSDEEDEDSLKKKFEYLDATREMLPARIPHLAGYPAWYRKLCRRPNEPDWVPGAQLISTSMQITPKLLSLTWESYPLHYIREHGWGFLIPFVETFDEDSNSPQVPLKQLLERCPIPTLKPPCATLSESSAVLETLHQDVENKLSWCKSQSKNMSENVPKWYHGTGLWCNVEIGGCCWFFKLPHKDGVNNRVGNPLAKDFLNKFSENVLASTNEGAEKVLDIGRKLSYWRNNHERVEGQLVVWLGQRDLPRHLRVSDKNFGAILPQVVVCGTLTRRAVEPTWMTASNAQKGRVGSELRAMVQAPPGYSFVGADVDSQELWIASVIGDAHFAKMHGATPLGWMTLSGRKADGTDMHSVTAKAIGISRDHAKVLNYARIYGAGQQFAERLLKQFNPSMSDSDARIKANKMFTLTKGRRIFRLRQEYRSVLEDRPYTMYEARKIRAQHGLTLAEMFEDPQWVGGTESAMFNRLEEIANSLKPVTPFLNCRLSRALEPSKGNDDRFLPTRVNWVVQSGAVDFLHLMLVCMRWLQGSSTRFCLSFHDEVRYLVPNEQRYQAALGLHITNLLVRAFCSRRLGLYDLPQSVAFFASVEVDTVLRKEAHQDCITPSNPHGLFRGYGIPLGESLDIQQAVEKAGHSLRIPRMERRKDVQSYKKETCDQGGFAGQSRAAQG
ncbi:DNA polymerase subunit gamma-1, mitochondrial [Anabrus simplex]|uniref:DNA polymerase subunit gamma-1, mitochondrial n=1 Tax=Anabrus simplex TaxID=316456 RepID=UPI0035A2BF9C